MRVLVLVLALVSTFALARPFPQPTAMLSLTASDWKMLGNPKWKGPASWYAIPLYSDGNGLYFDFVEEASTACGLNEQCRSANYLYHPTRKATISGAISMTIEIDTSGTTPTFQWFTNPNNTCTTPATVRPFIWAKGSYADGYRWWADQAIVLAPGQTTITIPLTPDRWTGVYGERANQDAQTLAWWAESLRNVSGIGMTFGGGCFYGHGVYITGGAARFRVRSYTYE